MSNIVVRLKLIKALFIPASSQQVTSTLLTKVDGNLGKKT